jgi:16S rRNA (cytosine1402-N4)-methyltransferase
MVIDDRVDLSSAEEAVSGGEHVPVLYEEVLAGLNPQPGGRYVDATAGRGGHAEGILQRSAPDGRVLALDADPTAVSAVQARLAPFGERATVVQANFRSLGTVVRAHGWEHVDGVLFDLGLSSAQLGVPDRGFSFASEGPLDMRFDPTASTTAAYLVNTLGETELARLFAAFGEEPHARRIARAIVEERRRSRIDSTTQLARLVERAVGRRGRIHPATRVFQALRIAVNGELEALAAALPQAVDLLRPGGRLAVIAFHSLEDRLTKKFLQQEMMTCVCPPAQPVCTCAHHPTLRAVTKGAVKATADEVRANRRARSARLRVAERLKEPAAPC